MKRLSQTMIATAVAMTMTMATFTASAAPAKSKKHADHALKMRKAVFSLLGSNMGPLGGMAKGKIPFDAQVVETNAKRISQLSLMMSDYMKTDTSKFKLKTDALEKIWAENMKFEKKIEALTIASNALSQVAGSTDEKILRKAIGAVGKTCGGCHDDYKSD
ncbi:MAG: cytochrome c [Kangiellaceae bacterium]|nr:cytochrome c [Kangiellaceae bacterium]